MALSLRRLLSGSGPAARLTRGWSSALVVNGLGGLSTFALHFLFTRTFPSAERYGVYVYVMAWVRVLLLPSKLGFDRAALKFVATYRGDRQWALLRGFLARSHQVVGLSGLALALLVTLGALLLSGGLDPTLRDALIVGSLLLPLLGLLELQVSCLRGLGTVIKAMAPRDVVRPLLLGGLVSLVWISAHELTPELALFLTAAVALVTLTTTTFFLRREAPGELRGIDSELETRLWSRTAISLLLVSGFLQLGRQVDAVMLGAMVGPAAAGLYNVPSKVVHLIGLGLGALNVFMAPVIAQFHAQDRREELQQAVTLASRLIFLFTVVTSTAVLIGNRWILSLFGQEFVAGSRVLVILTVGQIVNSLAGSVGLLMTMTGHERAAARIVGLSVGLNIVLNYLLIPRYGIEGAAVATLVSIATWNLTMVFYVRRRVEINPLLR